MAKLRILMAAILSSSILLSGCGSSDEISDMANDLPIVYPDTGESVNVPAEQETNPMFSNSSEGTADFVNYETLTLTPSDANPAFDTATGMFVIRFNEENIRFSNDDPCMIGISNLLDSFSVQAFIDTAAYPELVNGEYFTGVAVKPAEALPTGTHKFTVTFGYYIISFEYTVE